MRYKNFLYSFVLLFVSTAFDVYAREDLSSEHDIVREERADQVCDSMKDPGACFDRDRGKIAGNIVIFGTPSAAPTPEYDRDGLVRPEEND